MARHLDLHGRQTVDRGTDIMHIVAGYCGGEPVTVSLGTLDLHGPQIVDRGTDIEHIVAGTAAANQ